MSQTINLVDGLLRAARHLQANGQSQPAHDLLQRLSNFRNLPADVAEEVHLRLADLHAEREDFKTARRHLTVALTHAPERGDYHHRMACWIEDDADTSMNRAGRYYRQAVQCEPDNADYWADYGEYLIDGGRTEAGVKALRRASRLAEHDPELIGRVAASLREADRWDEARTLVRSAMFHNSQDRRFRTLWQQHQFARLREEQHTRAEPATKAAGGPRLLPFLRKKSPARQVVDGKIIRFDAAATDTIPLPKDRRKTPRNRGAK